MIEVENLVKKYGGHTAVDHLSFQVDKGQIYGFLGPNGAGKSTTMNIMTGYLAATEGTVRINGHDILTEPEEAKKCIGYLPEIPPLYPDMTVAEYLGFAAELKKVPKAGRKEQLIKVLAMTKTEDVAGRLIRNLSKGYKQRVGLAQALLGSPQVLILDEPTVGLDPRQIIEIRDLIRLLGKDHTVILSSHILSEVSAVCDHIMIISNGKMVASDSPEGLQKLQNGEASLRLTVIGKKDTVEPVLKETPYIKQIHCETGEEPDTLLLMVEGEDLHSLRRAVGTALAKNGVPVLSMRSETGSLEDVFLTLTEATDSWEAGKAEESYGASAPTEEEAQKQVEAAGTRSSHGRFHRKPKKGSDRKKQEPMEKQEEAEHDGNI